MNNDQVFLDAVNDCTKEITLPFLVKKIVEDKTKTLRKYMKDFGVLQLALYLQELAKRTFPSKELYINLNGTYKKPSVANVNTYDPDQMIAQKMGALNANPYTKSKVKVSPWGISNADNQSFQIDNGWTISSVLNGDGTITTTKSKPPVNGIYTVEENIILNSTVANQPLTPIQEMTEEYDPEEDGDLFDE